MGYIVYLDLIILSQLQITANIGSTPSSGRTANIGSSNLLISIVQLPILNIALSKMGNKTKFSGEENKLSCIISLALIQKSLLNGFIIVVPISFCFLEPANRRIFFVSISFRENLISSSKMSYHI